MRTALLLLVALAPHEHAQVVECPKFYPWEDTVLAEAPYRHQGKGVVAKGRLRGASLSRRVQRPGGTAGHAQRREGRIRRAVRVCDGESKWLVCTYGGGIAWREQLDSKVTSCKLSVREAGTDPLDIKIACK